VIARSFSAGAERVEPFLLADIGEGIAEVELMKWFVKEGEVVRAFDRICEVQSDKATVEITSKYDGTVVSVNYEEGAIVPVGSALVDIRTVIDNDEAAPMIASKDLEDTAPKLSVPHNDGPSGMAQGSGTSNYAPSGGSNFATPAVRKMCKENNIDLNQVQGTGPKGRVLKDDVAQHIAKHGKGSSPVTNFTPSFAVPDADLSAAFVESASQPPSIVERVQPLAEDKVVPIKGVARLMVKSMQAALTVQHLTLGEEVSLDRLVELRTELKQEAQKAGLKLSYMPFIIKAVSLALTDYPQLNATVNAECTEMVYHASHNIGVAMDTPNGLVVPVIRNVNAKSLFEIAEEMGVLQTKAVEGKLTEQDFRGGTFSLSNIGSLGGTYATPVLVVPQVAIGAFGRMQTVPRYVNASGMAASAAEIHAGAAEVMPSTIMNVSWSADHRVVDGASVARFSNTWKNLMENPAMMLSRMR
jgi:2-oxoisovalerate dehydrogenase E2 component (dihydrolipoyl transacylase)